MKIYTLTFKVKDLPSYAQEFAFENEDAAKRWAQEAVQLFPKVEQVEVHQGRLGDDLPWVTLIQRYSKSELHE